MTHLTPPCMTHPTPYLHTHPIPTAPQPSMTHPLLYYPPHLCLTHPTPSWPTHPCMNHPFPAWPTQPLYDPPHPCITHPTAIGGPLSVDMQLYSCFILYIVGKQRELLNLSKLHIKDGFGIYSQIHYWFKKACYLWQWKNHKHTLIPIVKKFNSLILSCHPWNRVPAAPGKRCHVLT